MYCQKALSFFLLTLFLLTVHPAMLLQAGSLLTASRQINLPDNHLMLVDLQNLDRTGKEVEKLLDEVHITVNKNTVPNDPKSPFVTSGIRIGTPAVTTRGANEADMETIAEAIKAAVIDDDKARAEALVKSIVEKYPLYA